MSLVQWKAIFDRLEALEQRVAELERQQSRDISVYPGPLAADIKRGPGRPRREPKHDSAS